MGLRSIQATDNNYLQLDKFKPPRLWNISSNTHLDLGCGFDTPRNPFNSLSVYGADIFDLPERNHYFKVSRENTIEVADNYFDSISAVDVLEHLSREGHPNQFIRLMNEIWRILKPGGIFLAVTPAFPNATVFQDPTHVNIITDQTINYFVGNQAGAQNLQYGFIGNFELISQFWNKPRIDIRNQHWSQKISRTQLFKSIFLDLNKIRFTLSQYRNPSHLVWVLRKRPITCQ